MPKSSIASAQPSERSASSVSRAKVALRISTPSVISMASSCASSRTPDSWRARKRVRSGPQNSRADTLIDTGTGCMPLPCQLISCRTVVRATQRSMSEINPVCSAIGMKSAGDTNPRTGCSQRSSASAPHSRRSSMLNFGWKYSSSAPSWSA